MRATRPTRAPCRHAEARLLGAGVRRCRSVARVARYCSATWAFRRSTLLAIGRHDRAAMSSIATCARAPSRSLSRCCAGLRTCASTCSLLVIGAIAGIRRRSSPAMRPARDRGRPSASPFGARPAWYTAPRCRLAAVDAAGAYAASYFGGGAQGRRFAVCWLMRWPAASGCSSRRTSRACTPCWDDDARRGRARDPRRHVTRAPGRRHLRRAGAPRRSGRARGSRMLAEIAGAGPGWSHEAATPRRLAAAHHDLALLVVGFGVKAGSCPCTCGCRSRTRRRRCRPRPC